MAITTRTTTDTHTLTANYRQGDARICHLCDDTGTVLCGAEGMTMALSACENPTAPLCEVCRQQRCMECASLI